MVHNNTKKKHTAVANKHSFYIRLFALFQLFLFFYPLFSKKTINRSNFLSKSTAPKSQIGHKSKIFSNDMQNRNNTSKIFHSQKGFSSQIAKNKQEKQISIPKPENDKKTTLVNKDQSLEKHIQALQDGLDFCGPLIITFYEFVLSEGLLKKIVDASKINEDLENFFKKRSDLFNSEKIFTEYVTLSIKEATDKIEERNNFNVEPINLFLGYSIPYYKTKTDDNDESSIIILKRASDKNIANEILSEKNENEKEKEDMENEIKNFSEIKNHFFDKYIISKEHASYIMRASTAFNFFTKYMLENQEGKNIKKQFLLKFFIPDMSTKDIEAFFEKNSSNLIIHSKNILRGMIKIVGGTPKKRSNLKKIVAGTAIASLAIGGSIALMLGTNMIDINTMKQSLNSVKTIGTKYFSNWRDNTSTLQKIATLAGSPFSIMNSMTGSMLQWGLTKLSSIKSLEGISNLIKTSKITNSVPFNIATTFLKDTITTKITGTLLGVIAPAIGLRRLPKSLLEYTAIGGEKIIKKFTRDPKKIRITAPFISPRSLKPFEYRGFYIALKEAINLKNNGKPSKIREVAKTLTNTAIGIGRGDSVQKAMALNMGAPLVRPALQRAANLIADKSTANEISSSLSPFAEIALNLYASGL